MENAQRIDLFKNMAEADPDNELAHFSLGKLYCEAESWSEAEPSLRRCLEINEHHSVARAFLCEAVLGQGRKDEAIDLLRDGVVRAHKRGEFMPRDKMRGLLESLGVEPPDLTAARQSAEEGAPVDPDAWVCRRCYKANPTLDKPPFSNELGEEIHQKICKSCWSEWIAMSIKVINEYRLNMATPEANETYDSHLREFLGL